MREYIGGDLDVFVYVQNLQRAKDMLLSKGELLSPVLTLGNTKKEVVQFITERAVSKEELASSQCQLI
jgi:hypothetical protein